MHAHRTSAGDRGFHRVAVPLLLAFLVVACSGGDLDDPAPEADEAPVEEPDEAPADEPDEVGEAEDASDVVEPDEPDVDPEEVGADELGHVPVLMYHRLLDDGGSEFDLTPEEFRGELEWLFENGYSPVRTKDLVRGEFDVPAGRTPVVLTFDDSTREQAQLTEDGELDPDTAMGILVDVAADFDEVEPVASLYVISSSLFGGTDAGPRIVDHLHDIGMEIGNHTHNHPNLSTLGADEVADELATNVAEVTDIVPGAEVVTLALPLGIFPDDRSLVERGSSDAGEYVNEGVLLVGSDPAPSPFAEGFEPHAIPRIRSSPSWDGGEPDFGSAFWLEQLDADGSYRRYISDGDPDTISFPQARADELDPPHEDRANPY